jgi:CheY-like chemotaxis protein
MSPNKTILIIDDEDDIREVASVTLELEGFDVLTAANGREGVARAAAEQPDAILLDVMMPELDGPATLALLQSNEATRDIPVVFLTAKVQAADRRSLAAHGARGILAKPFNPDRLATDISGALGW